MPLSRHRRPLCAPKRLAAFSLVEILISLAVIGTLSGGCYIGFNSINAYSVSSRLYSEAETAAQNQIDLILSKEPFDVMTTPARIPLELMTQTEIAALSPALGSSTPATTNAYYPYYQLNGLLARDAFIYTDPASGRVLVKGIVTSTVIDTAQSQTVDGVTSNLNLRRATVVVSYTFRNTNYNVTMDTIRTADR